LKDDFAVAAPIVVPQNDRGVERAAIELIEDLARRRPGAAPIARFNRMGNSAPTT
jgi:hypothetical protein